MRFLLYFFGALIVFTVFVTVFAASANARQVRLLPKTVWVLLCLLLTPVGGILYILLGRPIDKAPETRQVAPDDDPEFLRNLSERLKGDDDPSQND
jgi:hypothetical protein